MAWLALRAEPRTGRSGVHRSTKERKAGTNLLRGLEMEMESIRCKRQRLMRERNGHIQTANSALDKKHPRARATRDLHQLFYAAPGVPQHLTQLPDVCVGQARAVQVQVFQMRVMKNGLMQVGATSKVRSKIVPAKDGETVGSGHGAHARSTNHASCPACRA